MLEAPVLLAFSYELEKLGYGPEGHTILDQAAANAAARGQAGQSVSNLLQKGSARTDAGIRHPHLVWNDNKHGFPSLAKGEHGRNVLHYQRQAAEDIAKSITQPSTTGRGLRQQYRAAKGLLTAGEGQHLLADIGAHLEKPVEQGYATKGGRQLAQKLQGYGGGYLSSGREHVRTMPEEGGVKGFFQKMKEKLRPTKADVPYIDELGAAKADAASMGRAKGYGGALRKKVEQQLMQQHSHSPGQASHAAEQFFAQQHVGKLPELVARARTDVSLIGHETSRAARAVPGLLRRAPGAVASLVESAPSALSFLRR